jgi:hypothetical protein
VLFVSFWQMPIHFLCIWLKSNFQCISDQDLQVKLFHKGNCKRNECLESCAHHIIEWVGLYFKGSYVYTSHIARQHTELKVKKIWRSWTIGHYLSLLITYSSLISFLSKGVPYIWQWYQFLGNLFLSFTNNMQRNIKCNLF